MVDLKILAGLAIPVLGRATAALLRDPAMTVLARVKARLAPVLPVPGKQDLAEALRVAAHAAMLIVLEAARRRIALDAANTRTAQEPAFLASAEAWIAGELSLDPFPPVPRDAVVMAALDAALNPILADPDDAAFRAAMAPVEALVWGEFIARAGAAPVEVAALFRGDGDAVGWSALFLALMQEALRGNPRAAVDFVTSRLAGLDGEVRRGFQRMPDALMRRFEQEGMGDVSRERLLRLAQRLTPDDITDLDRAHAALKPVVDAYLESQSRPAFVRNQGDVMTGVMERIARFNAADDFAAGRREVDAALLELGRSSRERHAAEKRQREELIAAGIRQDTILGDADAVARWEEALVALQTSAGRPTWTAPFWKRWGEYYKQGDEGGNNFSLLVAIAMARRMLETAGRRDDRAGMQVNLGIALSSLGRRESGTARLEEAVAAYRAAAAEYTRERVPLNWAITQNNLGAALQILGERESGTARLEEAVAAYRAALVEYTRERVPLDWATTQNNLGIALQTLGERESGTARLEEAVAAYRAALLERTRERVKLDWAATQNNLGTALTTLGERESGTARLEEAVAAYRAALVEYTRERVPLDWAGTQNNLGVALAVLGERIGEAAMLSEAVEVCCLALEERTQERVPLEWAVSWGNLGFARSLLGAGLADLGMAEMGLEQLVAAITALGEGGHASHAMHCKARLPVARAAVARMKQGGV